MKIIPAIDIINGKAVRLFQGDYNQSETINGQIEKIASDFETLGATHLHLVDLDGAKSGQNDNYEAIISIAKQSQLKIEVGGGIRNMESIAKYLDNGIDYVILGTSALENRQFLKEALAAYHDAITVGIDARDGLVYGRGWLQSSRVNYLDFATEMEALGVKRIIVTDIAKDGTLSGPNLEMYRELKQHVKMEIIASGGIHTIDDIKALKLLGIEGAITGKAIYHQTLDLQEAIKVGES